MRFALAAVLALFLCLPVFAGEDFTQSAVKITSDAGHGSGVYIGNGYVLTAGHVAEMGFGNQLTVVHQRDGQWADTWTATVIWVDKIKDFGLLKLNAVPPTNLPTAKLNCEQPKLSENVTIVGWPIDLGIIESRGYIASDESERGPWKKSYVVVAPIFFGNSGGPIYDERGQVLGLAVGIVQGTSLAIMIPTAEICGTLPKDMQ